MYIYTCTCVCVCIFVHVCNVLTTCNCLTMNRYPLLTTGETLSALWNWLKAESQSERSENEMKTLSFLFMFFLPSLPLLHLYRPPHYPISLPITLSPSPLLYHPLHISPPLLSPSPPTLPFLSHYPLPLPPTLPHFYHPPTLPHLASFVHLLIEAVADSLKVNPSQCAGLLKAYHTQHGSNYPWTIGGCMYLLLCGGFMGNLDRMHH